MKKQFVSYSVSMVAAGLGVLVFFILIVVSGKEILADHPLAFFGLIVGIGISALGFLAKTNRLHLYAVLVFGAMAVGEILNKSIESVDVYLLSVFIAGAVIIISGCIILYSFLKKYPVVSLDE
jgi:hypothetical protein